MHGVAEHAGRHRAVAERLAAAGIEVHAYDLRGFGESGGARAYIARWSAYHDDLEAQLRTVRGAAGAVPVVLYGHSMGGLITLGYLLAPTSRPLPDLLVLSAPGIVADFPRWKRTAAALLGRVLPTVRIANDIVPGSLSHDPAVELAYRADPLNVHSTTARLGMEGLQEQARVVRALDKLDGLAVPTYVIQGGDDHLVPLRASELLDGKSNVTRRVYPGLRHELHNEAEAPRVIDDTIAWIREQARGSVGV